MGKKKGIKCFSSLFDVIFLVFNGSNITTVTSNAQLSQAMVIQFFWVIYSRFPQLAHHSFKRSESGSTVEMIRRNKDLRIIHGE